MKGIILAGDKGTRLYPMTKALIIAYNDLNNSGVPNVIYQTIKALHDQYSFDVLVFRDDDYYYQRLHKEGIDINLIKYNEKKPKRKIRRLFWWFYKSPRNHYLFMKKFLKDNNYSVIHSFKEYYSWPFFKAAKEAGIEKRILHRNINPKKPHNLLIRLLESRNRRLSIKYASTLIGVSELCCKNAFKNKKYTVLYNSYDEQKYNTDVNNKLTDDELVITHVASYGENKNQLFSLQVIKELKKLHQNTRLNLVGATEMNPYYQQLIDYVKDNHLEDSVAFIKRTDSVNKIYEHTTFTILPSFSEGLPLTVIEAQACGITVFVSTNVTVEINSGGVKFLNLSMDATDWASIIYEIFNKQKNSRTKYNVEKFSSDIFKETLLSLYKNGAKNIWIG